MRRDPSAPLARRTKPIRPLAAPNQRSPRPARSARSHPRRRWRKFRPSRTVKVMFFSTVCPSPSETESLDEDDVVARLYLSTVDPKDHLSADHHTGQLVGVCFRRRHLADDRPVPHRVDAVTSESSSSLWVMSTMLRPSAASDRSTLANSAHSPGVQCSRARRAQKARFVAEDLHDLNPLPGPEGEGVDWRRGVDLQAVALGHLSDPIGHTPRPVRTGYLPRSPMATFSATLMPGTRSKCWCTMPKPLSNRPSRRAYFTMPTCIALLRCMPHTPILPSSIAVCAARFPFAPSSCLHRQPSLRLRIRFSSSFHHCSHPYARPTPARLRMQRQPLRLLRVTY